MIIFYKFKFWLIKNGKLEVNIFFSFDGSRFFIGKLHFRLSVGKLHFQY